MRKIFLIITSLMIIYLSYEFINISYSLIFPITANQIVGYYGNTEEAIKKIELWQLNNIRIVECKLWKYPCISNRYYLSGKVVNNTNICLKGGSDTRWVRFNRCGSCGENSFLFSEFANSVGIETRSIHDVGLDHAWDESYINDSWIVVDPSQNQYNLQYDYYENKDWGYKNHTYVYALYQNGSKIDRTAAYTKTVKLSVFVKSEKNFKKIKIIPTSGRNYLGVECLIDSNNYCIFNLGDYNNYLIIAEKYGLGWFIKYYDEKEVKLSGDFLDVEIVLSPKVNYKPALLWVDLIIFIIALSILQKSLKSPKAIFIRTSDKRIIRINIKKR